MKEAQNSKSCAINISAVFDVLRSFDAAIMVSALKDCEVLYANKKMLSLCNKENTWQNKTCHSFVFDSDTKCADCRFNELNGDFNKVVKWQAEVPNRGTYNITAMLIKWHSGEDAALQFGVKAIDNEVEKSNLASILNGMEALVTVCDPDNFDVLFLNDAIRNHFGITRSGIGEKCYKILQNLDEPCPTCPHKEIIEKPNESIIWEHKEQIKGSILRKTARLIDWPGGKKAHLEYAIDISDAFHLQKNIEKLKREVEKIYYDQLTGIYNRRYFDESKLSIETLMNKPGFNLTIMMIDIDNFKNYNDTYGHLKGDECLQLIASTLHMSTQRSGDYVARYGGEEFIVVLPNTDEKGAHIIAEKMLWDIRRCAIPHENSDAAPFVTVSIGVCTSVSSSNFDISNYVKLADDMLYKAKREGRNRYCFSLY